MNRRTKVRVLTDHEHYAVGHALVVRQAGDDERVTLQVRRVIPTGSPEELQIEITIEKVHRTRTTQTSTSFCVPPAIADMIGNACLTLWDRIGEDRA
jgi:hypothetical protein